MSSAKQEQRRSWRYWALLGATAAVVTASAAACGSVGYYAQAVSGGTKILLDRQPIERLLGRDDLDGATRRALVTVLEARAFAVDELALADNRSYRSYVELDRPYAVWNVTAAPRLSLEPKRWCFLFAGCVSYRGYFSQRKAERFAARLADEDWDVAVGGVLAYSTLGWFADPVLSTFLVLPEEEMVALLFHELAHQRLYLQGDTVLNESFATAVEIEGMLRWLAARDDEAARERYLQGLEEERAFLELVLGYRERLEELYRSELGEGEKLERKAKLIEALKRDYMERHDADARFARWFDRDLNNAHFTQVAAYHELVPEIRALLAATGGDWQAFYERVAEWARAEAER